MKYFIFNLFILNILYFIIQYILYTRYKVCSINNNYCPKLSVIIPVFNEEKYIVKTIKSVLKSEYNNEIEIIIINDGSTDNTENVVKDFINFIEPINIENRKIHFISFFRNRGKRTAIYEAVKFSHSDIIVTLDSDTIINEDALLNLVQPFNDEKVGAVAGNIKINNHENIFSSMLEAAFCFGFGFLRPAQSSIGSVLCTPGALSAYRKSVIIDDLEEWKNQMFLFHPAIIGEDRALTNIVLNKNYKVLYQENSIAYTNVPNTFFGMINMFIRWIRGDIRESFILFKLIFKKNTVYNKSLTIFNLIMQFIWLLSSFLIVYFVYSVIISSTYLIFCTCFTFLMLFWSILPIYICVIKHSVKLGLISVIYSFFNACVLFWIIPYCWITLYSSSWITRKSE